MNYAHKERPKSNKRLRIMRIGLPRVLLPGPVQLSPLVTFSHLPQNYIVIISHYEKKVNSVLQESSFLC